MQVVIAKIFYYRACGYFGVNARKQLRTQVTTSWLVERGASPERDAEKTGRIQCGVASCVGVGRRSL